MNIFVRALRMFGLTALWLLTFVSLAAAQSRPQAASTPRSRMAIVDVVQNAARQQLDRPLVLDVRSLKQKGSWAFLYSVMLGADGKPIDLAGTRLEEAAKEGVASRVFCALLHFREGRWTIVASCLGATDVAWTGWDQKYGAPREVFELGGVD